MERMKRKIKDYTIAKISYIVVAVLFIAFFIYISIFEKTSVYQSRKEPSETVIDQITVAEIEDESVPVGIRKEYTWVMNEENMEDGTLAFYVVHQYVQVYIDDELVYSLTKGENNRVILSPGNGWVTVPICADDMGKTFRVVLTPVYESVKDRQVELCYGSMFSIYLGQMRSDLPQIILSLACIVTGAVFVIGQCILLAAKKSGSTDYIWIGIFAVLLGTWRITDTRFAPWMFPKHSMLLAYLALGSLFMIMVPMLLFIKSRFFQNRTPMLDGAALLGVAVAAAALFCQVTGIAELRQMITLCHITILSGIFAIIVTEVGYIKKRGGRISPTVIVFSVALSAGTAGDLILYYCRRSSSNTVFLMAVFLIYLTVLLVIRMQETMHQVYTDSQTSLFNKKRWNIMMKEEARKTDPIGVMMLDLNGLKMVNDTMGHDVGDKMIFNFANMLRNTIPPSDVVCRWGGDEFAVLITGADREKMEKYTSEIRKAVDDYNLSGEKPKISYALGYVLSTDFPNVSRSELLKWADDRMYQDKRKWYAERNE